MKVSFPLSLKISLWLLLNLVLLGAGAVALLLVQGGLSWSALVQGPAGERWQELGMALAAEVSAADGADSAKETLAAAGSARGVTFALFRNDGHQIAGTPTPLPESVLMLLKLRRPGPEPEFSPPPPPSREGALLEPPPALGAGRITPEQAAQGRFLLRAGEPKHYFLAARVPHGTGRPVAATLIAVADSWWSLMRLLDLQPWFVAATMVLGVSILFWMPLVLGITHNLRKLTAATEQIAEGRFETRVATKRSDELGRLGESVNAMAARLDTLVNGQRRFLGDVAHELASPIGRLQVALEILESRIDPGLHSPLGDVREEVQQMSELVNELLAFTRAGMRPREANLDAVAIAPLVADVLAREDPERRIITSVDTNLAVLADAPLLSRAVANLVRNALRYSGDAGPITIDARHDHGDVVLVVADSGPGVPVEALARLGEPFFRPESARTRETGGVGLGLAIVRSAVSACGGDVQFSNRPGDGFQAEIRLRRA